MCSTSGVASHKTPFKHFENLHCSLSNIYTLWEINSKVLLGTGTPVWAVCTVKVKGYFPSLSLTLHHTLFSTVQILRVDGKPHYVITVAPSATGHTVELCVQQTEDVEREGWTDELYWHRNVNVKVTNISDSSSGAVSKQQCCLESDCHCRSSQIKTACWN